MLLTLARRLARRDPAARGRRARCCGSGAIARIASPEEAAAAAEAALAGFEAVEAVVGADGAGALAVGADGRLAAIKRHGARAAVREVEWRRCARRRRARWSRPANGASAR